MERSGRGAGSMARHLKSLLVFMLLWIAANYAADYVFELGADGLRMLWGYIAGAVGLATADVLASKRWLP